VAEEDKAALISGAVALVFPSLYEGFGLPVVEAMQCGTPVICSNTSSLPEVAGEAALLISPNDVRGWAEAIWHVWSDDALRARLRQRGLAQAKSFTWENAARKTIEIYETVVGQTTGKARVPVL
jgi:glycosyltransferase involved in cell wall biosynthesis